MRRYGLWLLFFAWLYGVPFLLIVGMVRRTSKPYTPTHAQAVAFGATTDALLMAGLILNAVIPIAGLLIARLTDSDVWRRHFGFAAVGMVAIYLAVAMVASASSTTLIGHVPRDREPAPRVTQCMARSGGHGCPGG